jgi:cation diffusion facilitator CzcD-associated flavoprotein CzcO
MTETPNLTEIRARYAAERARRLRPDGLEQFLYTDAREEPGAAPVERDPLFDEVDAIIVGAGVSGLTTAVRLRQAGLERIRVIDRAGDFGGTWYWNRYPAAQCDVESYIYMPLLEETGTVPTEKYAYQPEIHAHLKALAEKFDLYADACFRTEVEDLTWDDETRRWTVRTDRGDEMRAQFVVVAGGFLQRPKLPAIPGLDEFEGVAFHTSRWDYAYTGGEPGPIGGGLPGLADKRVAIIGTGATGLQCVTPVAAAAQSLHVFQRTPSAVFERNNRPTDPDWAATLTPGWQAERMAAFTQLTSGVPLPEDPIADEWTGRVRAVATAHGAGLFGGPDEQTAAEVVDAQTMAYIHDRIDSIVEDPATAEALKPRYKMMCKRPCFHDEYLATFNRPNVTLVDTEGRGIEKVTSRGVVAGGVEYEFDCLIFATGFDTRDTLTSIGIDIVGRDGNRLSEYWKRGMRTFHGFFTRGFPNCFFLGLTQTAAGNNFAHTLTEQAAHVGYVVGAVRGNGGEVVETTEEAQDGWVKALQDVTPPGVLEFLRACTPGYYNNEGSVDDDNRFGSGNYLGGPVHFFGLLAKWRESNTLEGLEVR